MVPCSVWKKICNFAGKERLYEKKNNRGTSQMEE